MRERVRNNRNDNYRNRYNGNGDNRNGDRDINLPSSKQQVEEVLTSTAASTDEGTSWTTWMNERKQSVISVDVYSSRICQNWMNA